MVSEVTLIESLRSIDFYLLDHELVILTLILAFSGFVSGVTGFGFSFLGAMGFFFFDPKELLPLLLILSVATQFASMWSLRHEMPSLNSGWRESPLPFIFGGFLGSPFGLWVLEVLEAQTLCALVGIIILLFCSWTAFSRPRAFKSLLSMKARFGAGAVGGIIGGFTAAPGSAIVIWATLTGISKVRQRSIVQPYIVSVQLFTIVELLNKPGALPWETLAYGALLCIVILPMNQLGVMVFKKITDQSFKKLVLSLLFFMGVALVIKGSPGWLESISARQFDLILILETAALIH